MLSLVLKHRVELRLRPSPPPLIWDRIYSKGSHPNNMGILTGLPPFYLNLKTLNISLYLVGNQINMFKPWVCQPNVGFFAGCDEFHHGNKYYWL